MADPSDLAARVEALEKDRSVHIEDIPLTDLMRKLEQKWRPNAGVLLEPYSITTDRFDTRIVLLTSDELDARISTQALDVAIRGLVTDAGAPSAGTNYSVTKNGTGDFTVSFGTAFLARPAISVYGIDVHVNRLVGLGTTSFRVEFYDDTFTLVDPTGFFCFAALPTT